MPILMTRARTIVRRLESGWTVRLPTLVPMIWGFVSNAAAMCIPCDLKPGYAATARPRRPTPTSAASHV